MAPKDGRLTHILLAMALGASGVLTLVHGASGDTEYIDSRAEWNAVHILQTLVFLVGTVGALALALLPGRSEWMRLALVVLGVGLLLDGLAHAIDGPAQVALIEAGFDESSGAHLGLMTLALWLLIPGIAFIGFGVAMAAWETAREASAKAGRIVAYVAMVFALLGSTAGWGTEHLEVMPGFVWPMFVLGLLWFAVTLFLRAKRGDTGVPRGPPRVRGTPLAGGQPASRR